MKTTRIIRFGVFEADLGAAELRKSGLRIKLREQPFQVLAALLDRPGEIVTREELCQQLWPGGTFVDFDHGLNGAVNRLREALGDSAGTPRYVETVPRRGYRFVAQVQFVASPTAVEAEPAVELPKETRTGRRWKLAVLACVAISFVVVPWARNHTGNSLLHVLTITSDAEIKSAAALSPDGNMVAYVRPGQGILLRQIGTDQETSLGSVPNGGVQPAWSPDGRWIAFLRFDGEIGSVFLVPAHGGSERKLATLYAQYPNLGMWRLIAWHPDSRHLIVARMEAPAAAGHALSVLDTVTCVLRKLTAPEAGPFSDVDPAVSPDGKQLAFTRLGQAGARQSEIHVAGLSNDIRIATRPHPITNENMQSNHPSWTPDGRTIVFTTGGTHRRALWRVPSYGGKGAPLSLPGESNDFATFAATKPSMVYVSLRGDVNIWRTSLRGEIPRQEPFVSSSRLDHFPEYSPDGKRICWISDRSGRSEIWMADADGSNQFRLTSSKLDFIHFPRL